MRRSIIAAAVVAALALAAPNAHAQLAQALKFGVSGGVSVPTNEPIGNGVRNFESKLGYNLGAHLGLQFPFSRFGLRADVGFTSFGGEEFDPRFGIAPARGRTDTDIRSGTLNAVVRATGPSAVKPYAIGGIGAYRVRAQTEYAFDPGSSAWTEGRRNRSTDFGLNAGLGTVVGLAGFSTFAEARVHYIVRPSTACDTSFPNDCVASKSAWFIPLSVGFLF